MKKAFASSLFALLLAVALASIVLAAPARAAQRTVLAGTDFKVFGPSGPISFDGPWAMWDVPLTGTFNFGALAGTEAWRSDVKLDFATGIGFVSGKVTFTDAATGLTCSGSFEGKVANYLLGPAHFALPCSDGSLLTGTMQDVSGNLVIGVAGEFHGELLTH